MENKWIWLVIGVVAGYYICKKREEKKRENQQDEINDLATQIIDATNDLFDQAIAGNYSVTDVKTEYNRYMLGDQ